METNLTALFLGDESTWDDVQFTAWSVHGLWGGHSISITGRGTATIGLVDRGARRQRRYDLEIAAAEARALLRMAAGADLLAVQLPMRTSYLPDEAMTTLALSKDRRTFSLYVWGADSPPSGLKEVMEAMFALTRHTADLAPAYEGSYEE